MPILTDTEGRSGRRRLPRWAVVLLCLLVAVPLLVLGVFYVPFRLTLGDRSLSSGWRRDLRDIPMTASGARRVLPGVWIDRFGDGETTLVWLTVGERARGLAWIAHHSRRRSLW